MSVGNEMSSEVAEVPLCCLLGFVRCQTDGTGEVMRGRSEGGVGAVKKPSRMKTAHVSLGNSATCPVDNKYTKFGEMRLFLRGGSGEREEPEYKECQRKGKASRGW